MPQARNANCQCIVCDTRIYRRPYQLAKSSRIYCSQACYGKAISKPVVCPVCGVEFLSSKNSKTCSYACSNKNRTGIKYKIGRPHSKHALYRTLRDRIVAKRGAMCETCAHDNANILQLHHIVERKHGGSNSEDNLMILCPNCHYTIHYGDSRSSPLYVHAP